MQTLILTLSLLPGLAAAQTIDLEKSYETALKIVLAQSAAAAKKAESAKEAQPQTKPKTCRYSGIMADRCVYICDNGMRYTRPVAVMPPSGGGISHSPVSCPQLMFPF